VLPSCLNDPGTEAPLLPFGTVYFWGAIRVLLRRVDLDFPIKSRASRATGPKRDVLRPRKRRGAILDFVHPVRTKRVGNSSHASGENIPCQTDDAL
jgi:hypothetical protein